MKAIWKNVVLADSNDTIVVEGNHYFSPEAVHKKYLQESTTHTICSWKGQASYYNIDMNGEQNQDAACIIQIRRLQQRISKIMLRFGRVWRSFLSLIISIRLTWQNLTKCGK